MGKNMVGVIRVNCILKIIRQWVNVYEAICFMSYLVLFCSCVFSVLLALRLPCLGKRELILVLFVLLFDLRLFGFCLFPLPLGVWEGLRFVIVALLGLFSYFLFYIYYNIIS